VTRDEALGVLRAIDEGVITVDDLGRCRPVGLRKAGQDRELIRVAKDTGIHYGIEWFTGSCPGVHGTSAADWQGLVQRRSHLVTVRSGSFREIVIFRMLLPM